MTPLIPQRAPRVPLPNRRAELFPPFPNITKCRGVRGSRQTLRESAWLRLYAEPPRRARSRRCGG